MTRILFVDDDQDALETYRKAVSLANHQAETAADAPEALQKIRDHRPFDLVFIDINLPEISGLDLIKQLADEDLPHSTSLIVLSALPEKDLIDEVLSAGAKMFLAKPVALADLLDVIDKYNGG